MYKDLTLEGKWFLPEQPDKKYNGMFTFTEENGCQLKLYDGIPKNFFERGDYPIILGHVKDDDSLKQDVTLIDCINLSTHQTYDVIHISIYACNQAYIGRHYNSIDKLVFDKINSSIIDLNNWLDIKGITPVYDRKDISINYKNPDEITFKIKDKTTGAFTFNYTLPQKYPWMLGAQQMNWIKIIVEKPLPINEILNEFFTFYKFIGLAFASVPPIEYLFVSNSLDLNPKGNPYRIQLIYNNAFRNTKYTAGRNDMNFIFSYEKIKTDFEKIIMKWYELYDAISPSINILNQFLLNKEMTSDFKLLRMAQAHESFHRELRKIVPSKEDTHDKKQYEDLLAREPQLKDWLDKKLEYSFEPNLRRRLLALLKEIPEPILKPLNLDTTDKRKGFAMNIANTRNYFTHFGKKLLRHQLEGIRLAKTIEKMKVCLICLLLKDLGFNNDQIVDMVQMHRIYPFIT